MATIKEICPDCFKESIVSFRSTTHGGRLHWSASYRCDHCGCTIEVDDWDAAPEPYRSIELEQDGIWAIQLPPVQDISVVMVLRVIRKHGDMSLKEAEEMRPKIVEPILYGTLGEMENMAYHLSMAGIRSTVVRRET